MIKCSGWLAWVWCAFILLVGAETWAQDTILVRVAYVGDGDTIWVDNWFESNGPRQRVRIVGVDAPEICQTWGIQARDALRTLIGGKTVRLEFTQEKMERKDMYGRWLARVVLPPNKANSITSKELAHNGVVIYADVGEWMVASGYAWSSGYRGQASPYRKNQLLARKLAYGLWQKSAQPSQPPWHFRRIHGSCYVEKSPAQ